VIELTFAEPDALAWLEDMWYIAWQFRVVFSAVAATVIALGLGEAVFDLLLRVWKR